MPEISIRKRLNIVRLYLNGLSYQEIVSRAGVSKGTVVNVINELKEGQFPALEPQEQVDALREIAVEVRRSGLSVSQAALGLSAFKGIESLGVPPRDLAGALELFRQLTPDGVDTRQFVAAAMTFKEIRDRNGRSPEELQAWMNALEGRVSDLSERCEDLEPVAKQVASLIRDRDLLAEEVASLACDGQEKKHRMDTQIKGRQERLKSLESRIVETQRLIDQMDKRYLDQEERARQAEGRLNEANHAVEKLTKLGLVLKDLSELATRLALAARYHQISPDRYKDWLFSCLENSSSLLGLDSLIKGREEELRRDERKLAAVRSKREIAAAEFQALSKQGGEEKAAQRTIRRAWEKQVSSVGATIAEAAGIEMAELRAIGISMKKEATARAAELQNTAKELGRLEEAIGSYAMVRPLINLLQGKDGVEPQEARIAATALCLGLQGYLERDPGTQINATQVRIRVQHLLEALELWST